MSEPQPRAGYHLPAGRACAALLAALVIAVSPSFSQEESLIDLLPDTLGDWHLVEPPGLFTGAELFRLIDGGAALYHEYGFMRAVSGHYASDDDGAGTITTEVYEMKDSAAAFGIFSVTAALGGTDIELGDGGVADEYFVAFWKGRSVVMVSGPNARQETMAAVLAMARDLDSSITRSATLPPMVLKFRAALPPNTRLAYVRGVLGVGNFYFFGSSNVFNVREGVTGARDSTRFFVFQYKNAREAGRTFRSATRALRANPKFSRFVPGGRRIALRDRENNYLTILLLGRQIIVVVGPSAANVQSVAGSVVKIASAP